MENSGSTGFKGFNACLSRGSQQDPSTSPRPSLPTTALRWLALHSLSVDRTGSCARGVTHPRVLSCSSQCKAPSDGRCYPCWAKATLATASRPRLHPPNLPLAMLRLASHTCPPSEAGHCPDLCSAGTQPHRRQPVSSLQLPWGPFPSRENILGCTLALPSPFLLIAMFC